MSENSTKIRQTRRFDFRKTGIKNLQNKLALCVNDVNFIDISENKFTSIPDIVMELNALETLICSHNMIRSLPSNVCNLMFLETLDLSCNHLTTVHLSVCKLECLKILLLSSNRLVSLPKNIGLLKMLQELDVSCNGITCLPDDLASLTRLRYLNLRHNKLLDIPSGLHSLPLEVLDLSENQLSTIPGEYHRIETLETLNLSGNPLNFPPANICNRGLLHVMKYLKSESQKMSRQKSTISSQINLNFTGFNKNYKSNSTEIETITTDNLTSLSLDSHPPSADFEVDSDNAFQEEYNNNTYYSNTDDTKKEQLIRSDSGYNTFNEIHKSEFTQKLNIYKQEILNGTGNLDRVESDNFKQDPVLDGHFRKNRNYRSLNSTNSLLNSSHTYRPTRFGLNHRNSEPKNRRASLPDDDKIHECDVTNECDATSELASNSQCVVIVDNAYIDRDKPRSLKDFSSTIKTQSNNSKSVKEKISSNTHGSPVSFPSKPEPIQEDESKQWNVSKPKQNDQSQEIFDTIRKFHKIIEAQLHVHINSKKLCEELADGVYLCHLANILIPHSIPIVHTPSPGQQVLGKQKSRRNLENFLETCRRNGVPETSLFSIRNVQSCSPYVLLDMAHAVDALIHSIREKKARPRNSPNQTYLQSRQDWHTILKNPQQALSKRPQPDQFSRMSSQSAVHYTMYRPSKSTRLKVTAPLQLSNDQIIHFSSEV